MAKSLGNEVSNVTGAITSMKIDELIANLAIGIARGQQQLDMVCMEIARFMGEAELAFGQREDGEPNMVSLLELGFTPNFYQFVDTILDVKVSVSSSYEEEQEFNSKQVSMDSRQSAQHSHYAGQSSNRQSGSSRDSSYGGSWGWGGWWWGGRYGGSSRSSNRDYSNASAYQYGGGQSSQNKAISVNTVDAKFSSTYNFSLEAASSIKTKIVPVPSPGVFEERIRDMLQLKRQFEEELRTLRRIGRLSAAWEEQAKALASAIEGITLAGIKDAEIITPHLVDVTAMLDEYAELTNDHWVMISDSLAQRKAADEQVTILRDSVEDWQRRLADKTFGTGIESLQEAVVKALASIAIPFGELNKKVQAMLAPPAEDEETSSQEQT